MIETGSQAISRAYLWEGEFRSGHMHPECWDAMGRSEGTGDDGFILHEQLRGIAYNRYGEPIGVAGAG